MKEENDEEAASVLNACFTFLNCIHGMECNGTRPCACFVRRGGSGCGDRFM